MLVIIIFLIIVNLLMIYCVKLMEEKELVYGSNTDPVRKFVRVK